MKVSKFNYDMTKKPIQKSNVEAKNGIMTHSNDNFKKASFVIAVKPNTEIKDKKAVSKEKLAENKMKRNNSSVGHAFYKTSSDLKKKSFVAKVQEKEKTVPENSNPLTSKSTKKLILQSANGNQNIKHSKLSNNYMSSPVSKCNLFKKISMGALKVNHQINHQNSPSESASHKQINSLLTNSSNSARQKLNRQTSASIVGINKARLLLDQSEDFNNNVCNGQMNKFIDTIIEHNNSKDFVEDDDCNKNTTRKPLNSYLNFYKGKTLNMLTVEKAKKLTRGFTSSNNINSNKQQSSAKQRSANPSGSIEKNILTKEVPGNNSSSKLSGINNINKFESNRPLTTMNRDSNNHDRFIKTSNYKFNINS